MAQGFPALYVVESNSASTVFPGMYVIESNASSQAWPALYAIICDENDVADEKGKDVTVKCCTERRLASEFTQTNNAERNVANEVECAFDTCTEIKADTSIPAVLSGDTNRTVGSAYSNTFDTIREVTGNANEFRYENAGYREKIAGNVHQWSPNKKQSNNGLAFGGLIDNGNESGCYLPLPNLNEVWVRLDGYSAGSGRWITVVGYDKTDRLNNGLTFNDYQVGIRQNNSFADMESTHLNVGLNSYVLHLKSDAKSGVVEIWGRDGLVKKFSGAVNKGKPFNELYIETEVNSCISDLIVSSSELSIDDHAKIETTRKIFPYLKSNMVIGKDDFAVSRSDGSKEIHQVFDPTNQYANYGVRDGITLFIKETLTIHSVNIYFAGRSDGSVTIYGSDDNENFISLDVLKWENARYAYSNPLPSYHYYKIVAPNGLEYGIRNITIDASHADIISFDTSLTTVKSVDCSFDTYIKYKGDNAEAVVCQYDTSRSVNSGAEFIGDTLKSVVGLCEQGMDTKRIILASKLEDYRYENPGLIEMTFAKGSTITCGADKSQTGVAMWLNNDNPIPIKPSDRIWVRFDVYTEQESSFALTCDDKVHGISGVKLNCGNYYQYAKVPDSDENYFYGLSEGLHKCLLYMEHSSGVYNDYESWEENGSLVFWIDGEKRFDIEGNINSGQLFDNLRIGCRKKAYVSNLIISSTELTLDDNAKMEFGQWIMPQLTSNGVIGKDEFACAYSQSSWSSPAGYRLVSMEENGYNDFMPFDANSSVTMYVAQAIKVKRFFLNIDHDATSVNRERHSAYLDGKGLPVTGYISASDDGKTFDKILEWQIDDEPVKVLNFPSDLKAYHYFKFYTNNEITIRHLNIDAVTDGATVEASFDTTRSIEGRSTCVVVDTGRNVARSEDCVCSTNRKTANVVDVWCDTYIGYVHDSSVLVTLHGITNRSVCRSCECTEDTLRATIGSHDTLLADTVRNTTVEKEYLFDTRYRNGIVAHLKVDTCKRVGNYTRAYISTCTKVDGRIRVKFDTSVNAPTTITWAGVNNANVGTGRLAKVNINMVESTITDTLQFEIANSSLYPKDRVAGNILDYEYNMLVKQTTQNGIMTTVQSMANWSVLTGTVIRYPDFDGSGNAKSIGGGARLVPHMSNRGIGGIDINFYVEGGSATRIAPTTKASFHFAYLAGVLGLTPVAMFDDFVPSNGCAYQSSTAMNLISNFFTWTKEVPWRQVNIFIRGDKIYAVQRGHESNTVDLSKVRHTRPVVTREAVSIYKTATGVLSKNVSYDIATDIQHTDLTSDGDVGSFNTGGTQNNVIYDAAHRPLSATAISDDGRKEEITYSYAGNQIYENHVVRGRDGQVESSYDIWTTNLGNNHAMVNHGIDGEMNSIAFTTNMIAGMFETPSTDRFDISASLKDYRITYTCERIDTFGNATLYTSDNEETSAPFPIEGDDINNALFREVCAYNSKIKETISVEVVSPVRGGVPDYKHIIDFRDVVVLDGRKYYLQSNNVTLSAKEFKQALSLVRWI